MYQCSHSHTSLVQMIQAFSGYRFPSIFQNHLLMSASAYTALRKFWAFLVRLASQVFVQDLATAWSVKGQNPKSIVMLAPRAYVDTAANETSQQCGKWKTPLIYCQRKDSAGKCARDLRKT